MRPLLDAFPKLSENIKHLEFCDLPTPVQHLKNLGDELGHPALYSKRDDLTGDVYGGQKVRTLEFLLANANPDGGNIVAGMMGASMALASNIYARKHNIPLKTLLFKQTTTIEAQTNLRYFQHVGADMTHLNNFKEVGAALEQFAQATQATYGHDSFVLSPNSPLGMLGYLNGLYELKQQIDNGDLPEPDVIYISSGLLGTSAGLLTGIKALGMKTKLVPCNVILSFRPLAEQEQIIKDLSRNLVVFLREHTDNAFPDIEITDEDIHFNPTTDEAIQENHAEIEAWIDRMQESENIKLDMMWTARVWYILEKDLKSGKLDNQVVLDWHTMNSRPYPGAIHEHDYHDLPQTLWRYFEVDEFAPMNRPDF